MKVFVSILVIVASIATFIGIQFKFKLTKKQVSIFILLTLFWLSVGMIRDYRKRYAIIEIAKGGLGLAPMVAANIAAGYGLISVFVRFPIFILSDIFNRRKIFIQIALLFLVLTGVSVVTSPNATTLYFSSLAMGFSASLISLFNVVFAETFEKEKALLSVSILSIAPLIAEFSSSALQYFILKDHQYYGLLWLFSSVIAIIAFMIVLRFPELKSEHRNFSVQKFKSILFNKKMLLVCFSAILISFIRFSTSGANLNAYVKQLNMDEFYISFIDVVFSISQLIAGVLMGLYIQRKVGVKKTLFIGLLSSFTYIVLLIFTNNTKLLFYSYVLHGFGYGICYNCLIGLAIQPFEKSDRYLSMGIFQMFFAIGVFYGDKVYAIIQNLIPNGILGFSVMHSIFIVVAMVCILVMLFVLLMNFETKKGEHHETY